MTTAPLGVAVVGASGRMGRALTALVEAAPDATVTASWSRSGTVGPNATGDLRAACADADVVIDFTLPDALRDVTRACMVARKPLLSGVTGLDAAGMAALAAAAQTIPVLHEHNLSVGVHVLKALVAQASHMLPPEFSAELVETHHASKLDAPSGTALSLAAAAGSHADMPLHALRGGTVAGTHSVHFLGPLESLELKHTAEDRAVFAVGALAAARWLVGQPAGRLWRVADWLAIPTNGAN